MKLLQEKLSDAAYGKNNFVPELWQECEISVIWQNIWGRCKVLAITKQIVIVEFYKPHPLAGKEQAFQREAVKFRPIQTKADKRRDEQIEKMTEILINLTGYRPDAANGAAFLYDAGCRMTRELTDADISSIAWGLSSSENKNEIKFACDVARAVIAAYVTGSGEYD